MTGSRQTRWSRLFVSLLMNLGLLLAFIQAPSLHIHTHEATQRHAGGFFHIHFHHPVSHDHLAVLQNIDPDDDAQFVAWTPAPPADSGLAPLILATTQIAMPPPAAIETSVVAFRLTAHSPPPPSTASSRAPPAI